jgi:DNA repair protein RadC
MDDYELPSLFRKPLKTSDVVPMATSEDVLPHLKYFRNRKQEFFICIALDSRRRVIGRRVVTMGILTQSIVHPRETFWSAINNHAASVILAHNHPSGEVSPSPADIETTQYLVSAGQLLGITVRDHIIVTRTGHYSFKENGLI